MEYTTLQTEQIPKIALGTWSWGSGINGGNQVFGNHLEIKNLQEVFNEAERLGLNFWDTAAVYGMGASEKILGELCTGKEILSTKFTPMKFQMKAAMGHSLKKSMKRLHRDVIDLYWIHDDSQVEKWTREIAKLAQKGYIKHIGVSNHTLQEVIRVAEILGEYGLKLAAVQNHYSLLYRQSEEKGILDWCHKNGVIFFSYMVLEQGALTGVYSVSHPFNEKSYRGKVYNGTVLEQISPLIALMGQIGETHHINISQVAIAWSIAKGTVPIIGVTKVHHVTDAAVSMQVSLTKEEIQELENIADRLKLDMKTSWEPVQS